MDARTAARIRANPQFVKLEKTRRDFGWTLSIIMLVIYYGFIALVAFFPSVIGVSVAGNITVGLVLGIAVILSAIVLTGIYVLRANSQFDDLSAQVVATNVRELEMAR
jgi:uncharacterized membrane protein (DUF485 family)